MNSSTARCARDLQEVSVSMPLYRGHGAVHSGQEFPEGYTSSVPAWWCTVRDTLGGICPARQRVPAAGMWINSWIRHACKRTRSLQNWQSASASPPPLSVESLSSSSSSSLCSALSSSFLHLFCSSEQHKYNHTKNIPGRLSNSCIHFYSSLFWLKGMPTSCQTNRKLKLVYQSSSSFTSLNLLFLVFAIADVCYHMQYSEQVTEGSLWSRCLLSDL